MPLGGTTGGTVRAPVALFLRGVALLGLKKGRGCLGPLATHTEAMGRSRTRSTWDRSNRGSGNQKAHPKAGDLCACHSWRIAVLVHTMGHDLGYTVESPGS